MALPFLPILGGLSAAAGVAQGAANYGATRKAKRANDARIDELLTLKNGGRFGLSDEQENLLREDLVAPTRQAAAQARSRAEQLGATGGVQSGADLARLRQEQVGAVGRAGAEATREVRRRDDARRQEQEAELAGRQALSDAQRADMVNSLFAPIQQGLGVLGQAAGAGPGTFTNFGAFGQALPQRVSREELAEADRVMQEQPEQVATAAQRIDALAAPPSPYQSNTVRRWDLAQPAPAAAPAPEAPAAPAVAQGEYVPDPRWSQELGADIYRAPDGTPVWLDPSDGQFKPFNM